MGIPTSSADGPLVEASLIDLPNGLPVQVEFYDGAEVRSLRPMHIDLQGKDGIPSAIVITVA